MKRLFFIAVVSAVLLPAVLFVLLSTMSYNNKLDKAYSEVEEDKKRFYDRTIRFEFNDDVVEIPMTEVGIFDYSVEMPDVLRCLFDVPITTVSVDWNKDALLDKISSMFKEGIDASMQYDSANGWTLTEDDYSRAFDVEELFNKIVLQHPEDVESIDMSQLLQQPKVKTEDIKDLYDLRSAYNDFEIRYADGSSLTREDLFSDEEATPWDVNTIDLSTLKSALEHSYNTTNKALQFKTTAGDNITVPYKTYGKSVNWSKEKAAVIDLISNAESVYGREPILTGYDNFVNTYIEISLDAQHLWHYVDGELCCETDVVTGTKNRRDTPTGVFYISECIPGKYLTGDDYKTWVNQWMRLTNSGVGLHDAYWRSSFGGTIYTYDGSHGCINLPKVFAANLFKEVKNGYPVVIY